MKKLSQNFISRANFLYEFAEHIGFLLGYLEKGSIEEELTSLFNSEFNRLASLQADEDQDDIGFIKNAFIDYLKSLSFYNQDASANYFINKLSYN